MIDLRKGDWRSVLADVERFDSVIVDPPYGAATHAGHNIAIRPKRYLGKDKKKRKDGTVDGLAKRRTISYTCWTTKDVHAFVHALAPRCDGWFVAMTSHDLLPTWSQAFTDVGRYVFAPLPFVAVGSRVRLSGDGPSSWTDWLVVARPRSRSFAKWGTLPGAYISPSGHTERGKKDIVGGKPLWLMQALVRDYTKPGDLVCDPCAGAATTLIAAATEGRRAIGAELDAKTFAIAQTRIAKGFQPLLFAAAQMQEQMPLL